MSVERSGVFAGGAALVWRRQRVLWWPYVVNLLLAHFGAHTATDRLNSILEQSTASDRLLLHGFHISAIVELAGGPANRLNLGPGLVHLEYLFFFFMLLATGGILESYWRDATLTTGEFFQNGGKYFWRFLRLVIFLLIALIPVGIIIAIGNAISDKVDKTAISPYPAVWVSVATFALALLVMMIVRLWFDIAEVTAVAEGEKAAWRCLRAAARVVWRNFGSLFWLYFRISFLAWLGVAILLHIWVRYVRPESYVISFVLAQLTVLFWMGMRWWQRASEVLWYQARGMEELAASSEPVIAPEPAGDLVTIG